MFNSKEIIRLRTVNQALRQRNASFMAYKNKTDKQKKEVIEKIQNFDYMKDNVFSLLREIEAKLK